LNIGSFADGYAVYIAADGAIKPNRRPRAKGYITDKISGRSDKIASGEDGFFSKEIVDHAESSGLISFIKVTGSVCMNGLWGCDSG
jgi:hypothetical protein